MRVVVAQNRLARAIEHYAETGTDDPQLEVVIAERIEAIAALQEAIREEPRGYQ
jgi:hypothetical protein